MSFFFTIGRCLLIVPMTQLPMTTPATVYLHQMSPVWEYYEPELIDEDGVLKAVCKYCGSKMTAGRKIGTTSLRNHIAEYCSKIPSEVRKKFVATMKKPIEGPFVFDSQKKPRVNDYLVH